MTTIEFTDEELKTLYDLVRSTKITATSEELIAVTLGRSVSPLLSSVYKVMLAWQDREKTITEGEAPPTE